MFSKLSTPEASVIAQHRLAQSNPILLLDRYGKNNYPNIPLIQIKIHPLGLADIRRSIYAHAPKTKDLSKQAEKLHRTHGWYSSVDPSFVATLHTGQFLRSTH